MMKKVCEECFKKVEEKILVTCEYCWVKICKDCSVNLDTALYVIVSCKKCHEKYH